MAEPAVAPLATPQATLATIAANLGLIASRLNHITQSVHRISHRLGAESSSDSALQEQLSRLKRENALLVASNTRLYGANAWLRHLVAKLQARLAHHGVRTISGWSISGISTTAAVLVGPNHAIKFVHVGSVVDGARIVALHPNSAEVVTTRGVLRAGTGS